MYGSIHLRRCGDAIFFGKRMLSQIVKDENPKMWRVIEEDGSLSDIVNRSRAIDAAISRALGILNRRGIS